MGPTGRASTALHFPSRYRETTMVGARTVPNAGRAGAAVLGVAALMDVAVAPGGGGIVIFRALLPAISYQRVASGGRPFRPRCVKRFAPGCRGPLAAP